MTGSLLQLASIGNEDIFFTGNPEMSFFKAVYKRHSNFSMENINIEFEGAKTLHFNSNTTLYATIPRYGDLLSRMTLEFNLPEIKSEVPYKWITNLGSSIINHVKVFIGPQLIEKIEGEYIELYHNSVLTNEQLKTYNELIGNVPELYNPYRNIEDIRMIHSTDNSKRYYNTVPNVSNRRISVPLPLWFSRHDGLDIPMVSLQDVPIKIEIELKSIKQLYIIGSIETILLEKSYSDKEKHDAIPTNIRRNLNDEILFRDNQIHPFIYKAPTTNGMFGNVWTLKPCLSVDYTYLDDQESRLMKNFDHRYLIDRVICKEYIGHTAQSIIDIELFNPTKEIYIVPKRDDMSNVNQHSNYTNLDDHLEKKDTFAYQSYLYKVCCEYYHKISTKYNELIKLYTEMKKLPESQVIYTTINVTRLDFYKPPDLPTNFSPIYLLGLFRTDRTRTKDVCITYNYKYYNIDKTSDGWNITGPYYINILDSTKDNPVYVSAKDAVTTEDIYNLATHWKYRSYVDIPYIDKNNYEYFSENIIKSLEIKFNGDVRLAKQQYQYYHDTQPYIHHTGQLPSGVLAYSFSIHPEKYQPSGFCNFSNFKSIEFIFDFKDPLQHESNHKKTIKYDIKLYAVTYNILKISNGECQLLFST